MNRECKESTYKRIKKAVLILNHIELKYSEIHKFRGFIGNLFRDSDLIHNHDVKTGKDIYRYPLIQFKTIGSNPAIIAVSDKSVDTFIRIFLGTNRIILNDLVMPIYEKDLKINDVYFGYSEETLVYRFISPWLALNQKNYQAYIELESSEKQDTMLKKILKGNILSMCKGLGLWLKDNQVLKVNIKVENKKVHFKGKYMIGFNGIFKINFLIPDYLGIGKSISRGFGTIRRIL